MGLFSKLSKKSAAADSKEFKSALLEVESKTQLTPDAVEVRFKIPEEHKDDYKFIAGQYINVIAQINGKKEMRSYSICTAEDNGLAIGVKKIEGGTISTFLVDKVQVGDKVEISKPQGNFNWKPNTKSIVAFAAGSGITPILSILLKQRAESGPSTLFYGNKTVADTMFRDVFKTIAGCKVVPFYSREVVDGATNSRMTKQAISEAIKADLGLLRADHFYICGPEEMIMNINEVLTVFGVEKEKIHFELFTTPVKLAATETKVTAGDFSGTSQVSAILDGEIFRLELKTNSSTILEALDKQGADVPYSCRGGVCCTCKAKIVEGSATMKVNFALTDEEVRDGYILTCQAQPTSEVLKLDFDV